MLQIWQIYVFLLLNTLLCILQCVFMMIKRNYFDCIWCLLWFGGHLKLILFHLLSEVQIIPDQYKIYFTWNASWLATTVDHHFFSKVLQYKCEKVSMEDQEVLHLSQIPHLHLWSTLLSSFSSILHWKFFKKTYMSILINQINLSETKLNWAFSLGKKIIKHSLHFASLCN